ncbi:MAG TPA: hypothetical protein ENH82_19755 [bacterium]|nr:hypothetical protein [bacterium]
MTTEPEIQLVPTLERMRKKAKDISWSKLSQIQKCPANWLASNFLVFANVESAAIENSLAVPGTVIQKMFEIFINSRIYNRPEMTSLEKIYEWFNTNTKLFFELCTFDYSEQYTLPSSEPRYYPRTNHGKARVRAKYKEGLDPEFKSFKPQFMDWIYFNSLHGDKTKFLERLNSLYPNILKIFLKYNLTLDKMLSEQYVQAWMFKGVKINGGVDFLYNVNNHTKNYQMKTINTLSSEYILIDGKHKISKYVEKEQLFFYATVIGIAFKKWPSQLAFLDWSKGNFEFFDFPLTYVEELRAKVVNIVQLVDTTIAGIGQLIDQGQTIIKVSEIPSAKFTPSQNGCRFCPMIGVCPAAIKSGIKDVSKDISIAKDGRRQAEAQFGDKPKGAVNQVEL